MLREQELEILYSINLLSYYKSTNTYAKAAGAARAGAGAASAGARNGARARAVCVGGWGVSVGG